MKRRIHFYLPDELVELLDEIAKQLYLSRNALVLDILLQGVKRLSDERQ